MDLLCDLRRFTLPHNVNRFQDVVQGHFYATDAYRELEQKLKNCRNQCWNCHLCERVYGVPALDSLVSLSGGAW